MIRQRNGQAKQGSLLASREHIMYVRTDNEHFSLHFVVRIMRKKAKRQRTNEEGRAHQSSGVALLLSSV